MLSTRELFLVLRARDEASRVLRNVSGNLLATSNAAQIANLKQAAAAKRFEQAMLSQKATSERLKYATLDTVAVSEKHRAALLGQEAAAARTKMQLMQLNGTTEDAVRVQRAHILALDQARHAQRLKVIALDEELNAMRSSIIVTDQRKNALRGEISVLERQSRQLEDVDKRHKQLMHTMSGVSQAAITVGAGMALAGGALVAFMFTGIKNSVEYQRQVALTKTQVDGFKASLQDLGAIGKRVAKDIAVPFEEMQPALYDIFSSTNANLKQSEILLRSFAKGAVAGQVSIQESSRATIGIMNAFHVPWERVNDVMDVQFQLVRKGVGTYQQFANTIGRAVPSTVRAGQSVQTLAGMLAFLTRNGLSAAMASASAGRALDAFSNTKVVNRLQKMGIAVKDARGQFRPLADVIQDLQRHFTKLTKPQLASALQDLFKGAGGTIQARRFFDIALGSKAAAASLQGFVKDMQGASGQMGMAFSTMANTTASKTELLKNNFKVLKVEMGEALTPVFNSLVAWVVKLFNAFNSLSPTTKRTIIIAAAITAGFIALAGVITVLLGALGLLVTGIAALGAGFFTVIGIVSGVAVAIIALGAAFIYVWKHSEAFRKVVTEAFQMVGDVYSRDVKPKLDDLIALFKRLLPVVKKVVNEGIDGLVRGFAFVKEKIQENKPQLEQFERGVNNLWQAFVTIAKFIIDKVIPVLGPILKAGFMGAIGMIGFLIEAIGKLVDAWNWLTGGVTKTSKSVSDGTTAMSNKARPVFDWFHTALHAVGDAWNWFWEHAVKPVINFVQAGLRTLVAIFNWWKTVILAVFDAVGSAIMTVWQKFFVPAFQGIQLSLRAMWAVFQVIFGLVQIAFKILRESVLLLWHHGFEQAFHGIGDLANWLWGKIKAAFNLIHNAFDVLRSAIRTIWNAIADTISSIWQKRLMPIFNFFRDILINHVLPAFKTGVTAIGNAWSAIMDIAKKPVRFVVDTVLNKGLLKGYNTLAHAFGVKPDNVSISLPKGFASGGKIHGPGGEREDKVPIWASNNEFIVNAKSTRKHLSLLHSINSDKYADGGLIGNALGWLKDTAAATMHFMSNPIGAIKDLLSGPLKALNDKVFSSNYGKAIKGAGSKILGGIKAKMSGANFMAFGGGNAGTGDFNVRQKGWPPRTGSWNGPPWTSNVAAAAQFIRRTWAGTNPGSYVSQYEWSDHYPKAIDTMTNAHNPAGLARGNAIASWFVKNPNAFGTRYVIWNKRITTGNGWHPYSVPGQGDHSDHVHVSFMKEGGRVMNSMPGRNTLAMLRPGETVLPTFHDGGVVGNDGRRIPLNAGTSYGRGDVTVNVHTNEINPTLHAQQLGWEVSRWG